MDDVSGYPFLASAIAGRRVAVQRRGTATERAWSDGQSVCLPLAARAGAPAIWADVVAQSVLIGAGSLQPHLMRRLLGRPESARRYTYLEVRRASAQLAGRLPTAFLELPEIRSPGPITVSAEASLEWALGTRVLPPAPAYFGRVRPMSSLGQALRDQGLGALTRKPARGEFAPARVDKFDDDQAAEESQLLKAFGNPFSTGNPLADMLNSILGAGSSRGRDKPPAEGGGGEIPVGRIERALRRGLHAVLARLPFDVPDLEAHTPALTRTYPEWDVQGQAYKREWVRVEEVDPWRPDGARPLEDVLKPAGFELKRQLGGLGLDHRMHDGQNDGAEIDVGRLLECAIDLAAGHSPPSLDIYRTSRRTRRDLAVVIALDISGSTGERDGAGMAVFERQLQTAYRLGRTLSDLGDSVAMFGFQSWGRNRVHAVRLKGPEEPWGAQVADRFSQLEAVGYTRTGAAIRHGTRLLQSTMRLPNRLLVLISDGIAYDQDYEGRYAEGDARKALEEARGAGTAVVCLCVGGSTDADKLRDVFGIANLLIVDEPRQVTARIRRLCRQALMAVSQRRLRRPGSVVS